MDNIIEGIIVILKSGGYVLIPIFVVAQIGWLFIIERYFHLQTMSTSQKKFWKEFPNTKQDANIYLKSQKNQPTGLFGSIVAEISRTKTAGERPMVNGVKQVLEPGVASLQNHFSTIAIMANSAPLLGLLGTVAGMVATFQVITQFGNGNPAMMATGISQALLTTQAGLVVSFPLVLIHNHLLNKADTIETECISGATRLINVLR